MQEYFSTSVEKNCFSLKQNENMRRKDGDAPLTDNARRFLWARLQAGEEMNQSDFAKAIGVNRGTYIPYEAGTAKKVNADIVQRIIKFRKLQIDFDSWPLYIDKNTETDVYLYGEATPMVMAQVAGSTTDAHFGGEGLHKVEKVPVPAVMWGENHWLLHADGSDTNPVFKHNIPLIAIRGKKGLEDKKVIVRLHDRSTSLRRVDSNGNYAAMSPEKPTLMRADVTEEALLVGVIYDMRPGKFKAEYDTEGI